MSSPGGGPDGVVGRYLELGLRLGRHVEGLVDAYYGPAAFGRRVAAEPLRPAGELVAQARRTVGDIDGGAPLDGEDGASASGPRRRWLRAQAQGLWAVARVCAGEAMGYADEVEACYGVRPVRVPEDVLAEAHRRVDAVLPGSGDVAERYRVWRETQAVPVDKLQRAIGSLAEDLRARTKAAFGLPEGERVDFELVTSRPWAGFNHYLGDLRSLVSVNVDLPVLSPSLAHLVAHEAYPGHHTEHSRKEVGLVRKARFWEETIFMVGTPQCLLAEGLADLGLEIVMGRRPEEAVAAHLAPLGIPYQAEVVAALADASEALSGVRANAAFRLHEDGADPEVVAGEVARWGMMSIDRARKAVEFLTDPLWRAYISCYVEGLPLCRTFVGGRPERFARLITEQLTPADLAADRAA